MKYKAFINQGDGTGCDYTIACAQAVIDIEADSMDNAILKLYEIIKEDYSGDERRLEEAEIYEINETFSFQMPEVYKKIDAEEQEKADAEKLAKDKETFEKLKKQFGE